MYNLMDLDSGNFYYGIRYKYWASLRNRAPEIANIIQSDLIEHFATNKFRSWIKAGLS